VGPKKGDKKFHVHISVKHNLKLIEEPQSDVSVAAVCMEYGLKKQTMANITQKKLCLQKYSLSSDAEGGRRKCEAMKISKF
jgi:hypothetical protein